MAVILIHTYRSIHIYIKYAHEMYAKASRVPCMDIHWQSYSYTHTGLYIST